MRSSHFKSGGGTPSQLFGAGIVLILGFVDLLILGFVDHEIERKPIFYLLMFTGAMPPQLATVFCGADESPGDGVCGVVLPDVDVFCGAGESPAGDAFCDAELWGGGVCVYIPYIPYAF
jgi:hypothetical protein